MCVFLVFVGRQFLILLFLLFSVYSFTHAQGSLLKRHPHLRVPYENRLLITPIFAYNPETNFSFGGGGKYIFKLPNCQLPNTRKSSASFSLRYTLNNQVIIKSKNDIYFRADKYRLKAQVEYLQFPLFFYGVGNDTPDSNEEVVSYHTIFIEPIFYSQISPGFFVGGGFRINAIYNVNREQDGELENQQLRGYDGVRASGLVLAQALDTRDNTFYSTKGAYIQFRQSFHFRHLGSDFNFQVIELDARKYWKVFPNRQDVLAVQGFMYFSSSQTPFTDMARLGSSGIMRGYYPGRYRDHHLMAIQVEYRYQLSDRIGLVGFAGCGDVMNEIGEFQLSEFKRSIGAGFRYNLLPKEHMNLRFDYAFGNNSSNFYFGISEAF